MSSFTRSREGNRRTLHLVALTSLIALASVGCAQNAILELYVEVPPAGTVIDGRRIGGVRVTVGRGAMNPVDSAPRSRVVGLGQPGGIIAVAIDRGGDVTDAISVEVAYCADTADVALCDVVLGVERLTINQPFYTGVATCFVRELPGGAAPFALASPETVGACEVAGCFGSNDLNNPNFCSVAADATTHFCNRTLNGDFCDALRGSLASRLLQ